MLLFVQIPAIGFALIGAAIFAPENFGDKVDLTPLDVGLAVIAAPILETFLITLISAILTIIRLGTGYILLIQAAFWGWVHGLISPIAAVPAGWAFLVFTYVFMVAKTKGYWVGFSLSAALHATCNAFAVTIVLLLGMI